MLSATIGYRHHRSPIVVAVLAHFLSSLLLGVWAARITGACAVAPGLSISVKEYTRETHTAAHPQWNPQQKPQEWILLQLPFRY